jgi:UDP-N-acetylglucosamine 2-epimerase (non-hydrolysing)
MPEEINRVVTDSLSDLLFTPSHDADKNLEREGITTSRIRMVGNIMIDTLVANLEQARKSMLPSLLGLKRKGFAYVTLHRPCNVDAQSSLEMIMGKLTRIASRLPVVFPLHPRTKKMLDEYSIAIDGKPNLKLIEPIGYHDSICLAENARFVLTDSGGLQEESTYFRTPCLTLRPNTERPITIELGTNRLTCVDRLEADINTVLEDQCPSGRIPEYWDGHTAERVINALVEAQAAGTQNS